jgi:hypothetical protein
MSFLAKMFETRCRGCRGRKSQVTGTYCEGRGYVSAEHHFRDGTKVVLTGAKPGKYDDGV